MTRAEIIDELTDYLGYEVSDAFYPNAKLHILKEGTVQLDSAVLQHLDTSYRLKRYSVTTTIVIKGVGLAERQLN